jgi:uncharacterized membrane protein
MSNQDQTTTTREQKRAQFSEQQPKGKGTIILVVVLVTLVAMAAYLVLNSNEGQPAATTVAGNSDPGNPIPDLRIPLADVSSGQAKFFDYKTADNRSVRFFVMKSSDGVYRAALDACDTCFHAKKGYRQAGDEMICNNCGLRFHSNRINEVSGGCNPIGLPRQIEGDSLVIKANELESRSRYF